MHKAIIIVAGGKGLRMGSDIPKQFLVLDGKPILMHTIERFYDYDSQMQIVVVLPKAQQAYWSGLCEQYQFAIPHEVCDGGEERFHSVKNGLAAVSPECRLIGIHDGVRPYVSREVIARCYDTAASQGSAIPVIPVYETIREMVNPTIFNHHSTSRVRPRAAFRLVQTPQVFVSDLIRNAYEQDYQSTFTDDATVVEHLGYSVTLVEGTRRNIKITTPDDL